MSGRRGKKTVGATTLLYPFFNPSRLVRSRSTIEPSLAKRGQVHHHTAFSLTHSPPQPLLLNSFVPPSPLPTLVTPSLLPCPPRPTPILFPIKRPVLAALTPSTRVLPLCAFVTLKFVTALCNTVNISLIAYPYRTYCTFFQRSHN